MISPHVRRLRLAEELRRLRTEAGLTQDQLARKIGQKRNQIQRLETAHGAPDPDDVVKILEAVDVGGELWKQIYTIASEAGQKGWWESNSHQMGARQALTANLEAGAVTIREYQQTFPPGLLQTEQFAQARLEAEVALQSVDADPEKFLAGRVGRQRMLRRPGGPTYEVIIDEVVIRRQSAPVGVVKQQLYHLAAAANSEPKITVRILPIDTDVAGYAVPRCTFSLYTYADPGDPTVLAIDTVTSDLVLTDQDEVRPYEELYGRLRDAALPATDSLELLTRTAATLSPNE